MRTKKSLYNMIISMISNVIIILIGLISQKLFLSYLGEEYLGLNGLFSNIISMLGIVEMGVGTSIIYHLYKPVYEKNIEEIKSLMHFYKISYRVIAGVVTIIGICILPLLPYIIGKVTIDININIIYILCLLDVVLSYFFSYKRSIINAHQENYIIQVIHIGYTIMMNIAQIFILVLTRNYYLYLFIKIIFRIIENLVIAYIANLKYPYIKEKNSKPLSKDIKDDIFTKIKALLFHKLGGFFIVGSDSILISTLLGVAPVGYYSNYKLVISAIQTIISQAISSLTSSIGNLLVETKRKRILIYQRLEFFLFWLATFTSASIMICMEDFVKIWIGGKYVLSSMVLLTLTINFYLMIMRQISNVFKEAAGIFYEDRFVPFLELFTNIILSVIFSQIWGLAGIFLGTICSNLILHLYSYPTYMYQVVFNEKKRRYYWMILQYFLISFIVCMISYGASRMINIENIYLALVIDILLSLLMPNTMLYIIYKKNRNFKYYIGVIISFIK